MPQGTTSFAHDQEDGGYEALLGIVGESRFSIG